MASSPKKLPFLPGYSINTDIKQNFHKKQIFNIKSGIPVVADVSDVNAEVQPNAVSDSLISYNASASSPSSASSSLSKTVSSSAALGMSQVPAWVAYDRQVLRFHAYFAESVHESPLETSRVRKCVIYFYLEDDSLHVAECRVENSGIPQGVFLKRHRIPKSSNAFFSLEDLHVGADLKIYGRTFHIYDCDDFTRSFYSELGADVGAAEECPADNFAMKHTKQVVDNHGKKTNPLKTFMEASLGKPMGVSVDKVRKFLENDRKVLRFYCLWNDPSLYGESRPYVLHYFLADECVEVLEVSTANSGRDPFPALLKKQRLPKVWAGATAAAAEEEIAYYQVKDFRIGASINVYGRTFFVYACDEFTKDFYKLQLKFTDADFPEVKVEQPSKVIPQVELPPYNGYGTEEDSLGSFLHLVPKPPKKNFRKLMEDDRKTLRFLSKLETSKPEDQQRRFIVSYYVADETVSVFEKPQRNSGFVGGKFLERSRLKNPATAHYFQPSDFHTGARLTVNHYVFELLECDQATQTLLTSL